MATFSKETPSPIKFTMPPWHLAFIIKAQNESLSDFNQSVFIQADFKSKDQTFGTGKLFLKNYNKNSNNSVNNGFLCENLSNEPIEVEVTSGDENDPNYSFNATIGIHPVDDLRIDQRIEGLWQLLDSTRKEPQVHLELVTFRNNTCKRELHINSNSVPQTYPYNLDFDGKTCKLVSEIINGEIIQVQSPRQLWIVETVNGEKFMNKYFR